MTDEVIVPEVKTAPAAPAPEVKPAPVVAPSASGDGEPEAHVYQEIADDPGLTMALQFVGKLGFGPAHPAIQAAVNGDFSFLKAELAAKGVKAQGFEHYLALAEKSWDKHVATKAAHTTATESLVHETVGGADKWSEIQAWAKANADDNERSEINAMLDRGGFHARAASALLASMHSKAHDTVIEPADAVGQVRANGAGTGTTALSPDQFSSAVASLVKEHGIQGARKTPQYAQLVQRREAYRG